MGYPSHPGQFHRQFNLNTVSPRWAPNTRPQNFPHGVPPQQQQNNAAVRGPSQPMRMQNRAQQQIQMQQFKYQQQGRMAPNQQVPPQQPPQQPQVPQQVAPTPA